MTIKQSEIRKVPNLATLAFTGINVFKFNFNFYSKNKYFIAITQDDSLYRSFFPDFLNIFSFWGVGGGGVGGER